jgi:hypothetical protein
MPKTYEYLNFEPVNDRIQRRIDAINAERMALTDEGRYDEYRPASIEAVLIEAGIPARSRQGSRLTAAFHKAQERGTATIFQVDEFCCDVLGLHPMEVYGMDWLYPPKVADTNKNAA